MKINPAQQQVLEAGTADRLAYFQLIKSLVHNLGSTHFFGNRFLLDSVFFSWVLSILIVVRSMPGDFESVSFASGSVSHDSA